MAEQTVYNRQAPFIEDRAEQLLATIFGAPAIGQEGDADYQAAIQGLANTSTSIPAYEVAKLTAEQQQAANLGQLGQTQQLQNQAILDAQRDAAREADDRPGV